MREIAMRRLDSQQIEHSRFRRVEELAAWLGATQAQDYPGGKWALGLRLPGSREVEIEQALEEKHIVRTWAMRGTLQFVAAADLRWMLALLAPRLVGGNARRYRELELDGATLRRSNELLHAALLEKGRATRRELLGRLNQHGISTEGQRAPYFLQRLILDGLAFQGVTQRNDPTYLPIEALPPGPGPKEKGEALAELARRYFTSRGPAGLEDFAWWAGLPKGEARLGLEAVRGELAHATVEGQELWWAETGMPAETGGSAGSPVAHLLPPFDELLIGYRERRASLHPQQRWMIELGNGMSATLAVDGRVAGTWRRTIKKEQVLIEVNFFEPPGEAERQALEAAAQRYGEFLGKKAVIV